MDRDTVRGRDDLERLLARLHSGEINLLVGTQMIAKGHDIHGVTLVGVVGCDHALAMPDFRAAERVFQLMTQVSGRAGRGDSAGAGGGADVLSGPLRDSGGGGARLCELCGAGAEVPAMDALSAVWRAGECAGAVRSWRRRWTWSRGWGVGLRRRAGGGAGAGAGAAPIARMKTHLPVPSGSEGGSRNVLKAALRGMLGVVDREEIPRRAVVVDVDPMHLM